MKIYKVTIGHSHARPTHKFYTNYRTASRAYSYWKSRYGHRQEVTFEVVEDATFTPVNQPAELAREQVKDKLFNVIYQHPEKVQQLLFMLQQEAERAEEAGLRNLQWQAEREAARLTREQAAAVTR